MSQIEQAVVLIVVTFPLLAFLLYANHKRWWYTGPQVQDLLEEIRAGHKAAMDGKDVTIAGKEAAIQSLTQELAAVRHARNEREAQMVRDSQERLEYVDQRREEERERAENAERLVAAFVDRFRDSTELQRQVLMVLARLEAKS